MEKIFFSVIYILHRAVALIYKYIYLILVAIPIVGYLCTRSIIGLAYYSFWAFAYLAFFQIANVSISKGLSFNAITKALHMSPVFYEDLASLLGIFMAGLCSMPNKYLKRDVVTNTHDVICIALIKNLKHLGFHVKVEHETNVIECPNKKRDKPKMYFPLSKCIVDIGGVNYEIIFKRKVRFLKKISLLFEKVFKKEISSFLEKAFKEERFFLFEKTFMYDTYNKYMNDLSKVKEKVFKYNVTIPKEVLLELSRLRESEGMRYDGKNV